MNIFLKNIASVSLTFIIIALSSNLALAQTKSNLGVSLNARFYWPHIYSIEIGYQPSDEIQMRINGSYLKGRPLNYFARNKLSNISFLSDTKLNIDRSIINVGLYLDYFVVKQFLPKSTLRDIAGGFKLIFGIIGDYDMTKVSFSLNEELINLKVEPKWLVSPYFGVGYEYVFADYGVVLGLDLGIIYYNSINVTLNSKSDDEVLNSKIIDSFRKQMSKVIIQSPVKFLASMSLGYRF